LEHVSLKNSNLSLCIQEPWKEQFFFAYQPIKGELSYLFFVARLVGKNLDNFVFENNPAKREFHFWKKRTCWRRRGHTVILVKEDVSTITVCKRMIE